MGERSPSQRVSLSFLSYIRAFTLVFDELWGEGKKQVTP
jgi:hypothetical protein